MYGENLKKLRKKLSFTQEQMACELGIPVRTYTAYERKENNPPYFMLVTLYQKYNVNLNWFVTGEGEMFNPPKYDDVKDDLKIKVLDILKEQGLL